MDLAPHHFEALVGADAHARRLGFDAATAPARPDQQPFAWPIARRGGGHGAQYSARLRLKRPVGHPPIVAGGHMRRESSGDGVEGVESAPFRAKAGGGPVMHGRGDDLQPVVATRSRALLRGVDASAAMHDNTVARPSADHTDGAPQSAGLCTVLISGRGMGRTVP